MYTLIGLHCLYKLYKCEKTELREFILTYCHCLNRLVAADTDHSFCSLCWNILKLMLKLQPFNKKRI